jgi:anti-sigma B factor antagonist
MTPHFDVESSDGITVVTLTGPKVAPEAQGPLHSLAENGHTQVVLDFSNVRLLSSKGLAIVFGLKKRLDARGGKLRLCGLGPPLIEMLRVTHMDGILDVATTREEALEGF